MKIELPDADIIDRITILEIKADRLGGEALVHVQAELQTLTAAWRTQGSLNTVPGIGRLREVNQLLWDVEDHLRACEAKADFGPEFVEAARSVYRLNDERALLKRQINAFTGSRLVEQKSYV